MVAPIRVAANLVLVGLIVLPACSDGSGPEPAFVEVVSGARVADTIGAVLPEPLVVRVSDARGGRADIVMRFSAAPGSPPILFGPAGATPGLATYEVETDAEGFARAWLRFGDAAGAARVLVETGDGAQVPAEYTIEPGAAAGVRIEPRDTALTLGAWFTPRAHMIDRAGNATGGSVDFDVSPATVLQKQAGGRVRGATPGRGRITATFGVSADSAFVSVVPDLVVAAVATSPGSRVLVRAHVSGIPETALEHLPSDRPTRPHWDPASGMIVYELGSVLGTGLWTVDANGSNEALTDPELFHEATWPRYSDDGDWV
ncbi:MAG TPA: hypothetical protein VF039_12275, partial [Longimicrobiales bacterium]